MKVAEVKRRAAAWVTQIEAEHPGLVGAHLVGGITGRSDDEDYPAIKDVDIHLIFQDASPILIPAGPFPTMFEVEHEGVLIEAGVKPRSAYASPELVLANPEIAQHMLGQSELHDPFGILAALHAPVVAQFRHRRWVRARVEHERTELEQVVAMTPMVSMHGGPAAELMLLGYGVTFLTAALQLASLRPLRMGGRSSLYLGEVLREHGRDDLYDDVLRMLGVAGATEAEARSWLVLCANLFDQAVPVHKTRVPFDHKVRAHTRDHFVENARQMIDEGFHREALAWIQPYLLCTAGILMADGDERARVEAAGIQDRLLTEMGFTTDGERSARHSLAAELRSQVFDLADQIMATNPSIVG